jgi:hypothetical protein
LLLLSSELEEARLELLGGEHPALSAVFENAEMQEILKDPIKFQDQVKEGQKGMMGMGDEDDHKKKKRATAQYNAPGLVG